MVPLIPSPLSSAVPVILPQAPSGPSYAIYLQPAQAQMLTPPHGLSPTVCPTQSSNAPGSKDPTDTPTEKTATDATKSSASCRPGSLQPAPERQGAKNRSKETTGDRGTKRTGALEDGGPGPIKKPKEDVKGLENVPTPTVSIASLRWDGAFKFQQRAVSEKTKNCPLTSSLQMRSQTANPHKDDSRNIFKP